MSEVDTDQLKFLSDDELHNIFEEVIKEMNKRKERRDNEKALQ